MHFLSQLSGFWKRFFRRLNEWVFSLICRQSCGALNELYAHGGCDDLHHFFQQEQTCLGDDSSAFNSPHTLRSSRTLVHEHTLLHTATPTFWRVKQLASLALIVQQNHESLTPLHSNAAIIRITNLCGNKIIAVLTGKFIIINDNHLSSHRVWELIFKS